MKKQTTAIQHRFEREDAFGSLSMPVYHTAAYEFRTASDMIDAFTSRVLAPDYSRTMNPTVTYFEDKVKALTSAANVFAFGSGMSAISNALLSVAEAGKTIITSRHLFGNSYALITKTLGRLGIKSLTLDLTNTDEVAAAVDDSVCCIYLEIVTNPQMEVADISALAYIAHSHGIPLIVDTTMIPFTQFSAKALGVDVEVVSSTKYISGGATSLGGLVIDYGMFDQVNQRIRYELIYNLGGYMTPHAAYMQSLGLETLDARYRVQQSNAMDLAHRLRSLKTIRKVNYLGFTDNPYHDMARKQFGSASGAMITIDLDSEASCFRFIDKLQIVRRATNLFDNKTLAIHPYSTIFGNFSPQEKAEMDVLDTTIRLSVGLEDMDDIFADIQQALE